MSAAAAVLTAPAPTRKREVVESHGPFPVIEEWPFHRHRVQWLRRLIVREPDGSHTEEFETTGIFDHQAA